MAKVFDGVDQIVMFVIKPMMKYGLLRLAKPIVCKQLLDYFFAMLGIKSGGSSEQNLKLCEEGMDMYFENFYFVGELDNQPYVLTYGPKGSVGNPDYGKPNSVESGKNGVGESGQTSGGESGQAGGGESGQANSVGS